MQTHGKLGIIAGGGDAPQRVIEACRAQKRPFFVICLEGQAREGFAHDSPHIWLPLGAFGRLRDVIAAEGIAEIVMIGAVRRPSLWELKPDGLALRLLPKIGFHALGDDGLLRAVGQAIETECAVKLIGIQDILGGTLLRAGALGKVTTDETALTDIKRGIEVARALGTLDVGQAVIVQQGLVLGVEAIEGTDALIARCGALQRAGLGGVLVKMPKPQQDNRFDLPTLGVITLQNAAQAGLRGVAAHAGRSLLIDRAEACRMADETGLFIFGFDL